MQKKQRIRDHHTRKSMQNGHPSKQSDHHQSQKIKGTQLAPEENTQQPKQSHQSSQHSHQTHKPKDTSLSQEKKLHAKQKPSKLPAPIVEDEEDELIAMYEDKLKLKGDKKYNKLAKKLGFDNDLFGFLDNISKSVKMSKLEYKANQEELNMQEESQGEDADE
jgi:hypothetical protein